MQVRPKIFISSVSKELRSARQLVANTLQFLGYEAEWQDIFETDTADIRQMLRRRIDECRGVVHLVGRAYGAEPPEPDEQFGRVSYTQYEALYAKQRGKPVWTFIFDDQYPVDDYEPEPDELAQLQAAYLEQVQAGEALYYPVSNPDATEAGVLKLRSELTALRRGVRRWAIGVSVALAVIVAATVWIIVRQDQGTRAIRDVAATTERTEQTTRETAEVADATREAAERTEATATETLDETRRTGEAVERTNTTIRKMDSREALDSASARLDRAVKAANLAELGQVAAIEKLLANGYKYENSKFDGVWLRDAKLDGAALGSSSFMDADLTGASLVGANLTNATAFLATADRLDARRVRAPKFRLQIAHAESARFDDADLTQASFFCSKLNRSSFRGANCTAVNFSYADLTGADFTGADLTGAQFIGAVIVGAKFDGATFKATDMSGALGGDVPFTDAQRAQMRRTTGLRGHLVFILMRKDVSTRFRSGFAFDEAWRVNLVPALGRVADSLTVRREDVPEPAGFTASWRPRAGGPWVGGDPNVRFTLDGPFIDIYGREKRIRARINARAASLTAAIKRLQTVEGSGDEFADWHKQVKRRSEIVKALGPLEVDEETRLLLALRHNRIKPADFEDWNWKRLADNRYKLEWGDGRRVQAPPADAPEINGWPRLYPQSESTAASLPGQRFDYYRDWTVRRAAALDRPTIRFELDLRQPRNTRGPREPGAFAVFDHAAQNSTSGAFRMPEGVEGADRSFPARSDRRVIFRLNGARTGYVVAADAKLTYPIKAEVTGRAIGFDRVDRSAQRGSIYDLIGFEPVSVKLTGRDGATWEGPVTTSGAGAR